MAKPKPSRPQAGRIRCAIYTRKSTEEGLEQAFNSLDAQREACAAYILSQRHEGWALLPNLYDDGGFSGGTMERPGLRQLMADVAAGEVDVIVVYKVDRLTRSLADFAKIVEVLDGAGASFVSVTQAFNTTTSMGRLTLNVLLSFAQFEREVTGERIRDKVAASKRKGMWMGGNVPLGYDVQARKLIINAEEAETVRHIFQRYLELGSTTLLAGELECAGIRSKARLVQDGVDLGSRVLSRGALAHMLKNRIYVGEIMHKDEAFTGEHAPIIDRLLWDEVQARLATNRMNRGARPSRRISLLAGRISDAEGRPMAPSHANKQGRRYRYYVTRANATGRSKDVEWRVPAGEIEQLVTERTAAFLRDASAISSMAAMPQSTAPLPTILAEASELATRLLGPDSAHAALVELDAEVQIKERQVTVNIAVGAMFGNGDGERHMIAVPARLTRRGHELRLAYPPADQRAPAEPDVKLVGLIGKAEAAHRELLGSTIIEKNRRAHLMRLARLRFLAPDIVTAILDGRHPVELSARKLLRADIIPLDWLEQRRVLGFT